MRGLVAIVPNPSLDRVTVVPELAFGRPLRALRGLEWPGGSGTHAALVARSLGTADVTVVAPVGGTVGRIWVRGVEEHGIRAVTVAIAGPTRSNVSVLDARGVAQLEVVEPGPALDSGEAAAFLRAAVASVTAGSVVVLSGSRPAGLDASLVTQVASRARRMGATLICDLGGAALGQALDGGADWVKANLDEASAWWAGGHGGQGGSHGPSSRRAGWSGPVACLEEMTRLHPATNIVLTMGGAGALWRGPDGTFRLPPQRVVAFNPIGCGDAMVGAIASALCADLPATEAARWGVAAAADNLTQAEPGTADRQRFTKILASVTLEPIIQGASTEARR